MEKSVIVKTTVTKETSNSLQSLKKVEDAVTNETTKREVTKRALSPIATQRTIVISRTNQNTAQPTASMTQSFESYSDSKNANVTSNIEHYKKGREAEKTDLRNLNEKLAGYIEQVRFLEAQNKKQSDELATLRERWGKDTVRVKEMYTIELSNLQDILAKADKERAKIELDLHNLTEELKKKDNDLSNSQRKEEDIIGKLEKCGNDLIDAESMIKMLQKRISNLEEQRKRDRSDIVKMREDMQNILSDLNNETMKYLNCEYELQAKKDELEFLKQVHEAQLNELSELVYRDTTKENKEFWKAEMAMAMQDIQCDYDDRMETLRSTVESQCNMNMQDIKSQNAKLQMELISVREENKRIKGQLGSSKNRIPDLENKISSLERALADLRQELEENKRDYTIEFGKKTKDLVDCEKHIYELQKQLKILLDDKLSLQLEIAAYRKLLEGEETRWNNRTNTLIVKENGSLSNTITNFVTQIQQEEKITKTESKEMNQTSSFENASRTTFNRTAKGNIVIQECTSDGRCIILENNGNKKEDISDMVIQRDVDQGKQQIKFVVPKKVFIDQGKTVKIWAKGFKPVGSNDLEASDINFGIGSHLHTILTNSAGEERATYTQKTVVIKKVV